MGSGWGSCRPECNMNLCSRISRAAMGLLLLLTGCDQLPLNYPRVTSFALLDAGSGRLATWIEPQLAAHRDLSGFRLLPAALDAYVARLMLIDAADRTLDLQYFIVEKDVTSTLLAAHLLAAADRGVRVRLLVDDWNQAGKDHFLTMLASHPSIEVRTFNPIGCFRSCLLSRPLAYAFGPNRVRNRMHNKALIADNVAVIVGGRNLGDEYFAANNEFNFGDLDLLALGPIAKPVSAFFDE